MRHLFFLVDTGIASETLFKIKCAQWKQWQAEESHLSYEYRIRQKGVERSFLLFFSNEPISEPLVFPVGNPAYNFLGEVVIVVIDHIGDGRKFILPVTVWH